MSRIEIVNTDGSRISIDIENEDSLRGSRTGGQIYLSDAMRRTPNIGDDEDDKSEALEDEEEKIAHELDLSGKKDELISGGILWRPAESIRKLIAQLNVKYP